MSIRVVAHGNHIEVTNPANGQKTQMTVVVFEEEGRSGANVQLSASSDFLSRIIGDDMGLPQIRTHSQAFPDEKLVHLPVGTVLPGHINRTMYSTPQMRQQIPVPGRMINGRPTYFVTELSEIAKDDVDLRVDVDTHMKLKPEDFFNTAPSGANVVVLEERPVRRIPAANPANVNTTAVG